MPHRELLLICRTNAPVPASLPSGTAIVTLNTGVNWKKLRLSTILLVCAGCGQTGSEAELQRQFSKQRTVLDELVRLSTEDKAVWRVAPTFFMVDDGERSNPREGSAQDLPPQRLARYRELLKKAGLKNGFLKERSGGGERLFFPVQVQTIGADSIEKGWAYLPAEPAEVVPSLDAIDLGARRPQPAFQPLASHWYLYGRYIE